MRKWAYQVYSESVILRISFTNVHSFLINCGFVSCMSLKNSGLLSPGVRYFSRYVLDFGQMKNA